MCDLSLYNLKQHKLGLPNIAVKDFLVSFTLLEINFGELKASKSLILTLLYAPMFNFD